MHVTTFRTFTFTLYRRQQINRRVVGERKNMYLYLCICISVSEPYTKLVRVAFLLIVAELSARLNFNLSPDRMQLWVPYTRCLPLPPSGC